MLPWVDSQRFDYFDLELARVSFIIVLLNVDIRYSQPFKNFSSVHSIN